jgi:hypothetical protein
MKDTFQNIIKRNEIAKTYLHSSIGGAVKIILNICIISHHKNFQTLLPILRAPSTFEISIPSQTLSTAVDKSLLHVAKDKVDITRSVFVSTNVGILAAQLCGWTIRRFAGA